MQAIVDTYLAGLSIGDGTRFEQMTLFPVFCEVTSPLHYRVLSEALADGSVEVREKAAASVPELWLCNRSETMVLVMGGEEVVGGKQNRMVNASFLIAPKCEVALPVTCVEQRRWAKQTDRFSAGEAVYHSLRRETHKQVREGLRASGRPVADQGAVWEAISDTSNNVWRHVAWR